MIFGFPDECNVLIIYVNKYKRIVQKQMYLIIFAPIDGSVSVTHHNYMS